VKYIVLLIVIPIMFVGFVEFILVAIETISSVINRHKRQKEIETIRRDFLNNPVEMVSDKGKVFWIGYKK